MFIQENLHETMFMQQSPGFTHLDFLYHVCRLRKSLYGLKQAPMAWYRRFPLMFCSLSFWASVCDTSLFTYRQENHIAYLLLYVDGIVLTASDTSLLNNIISRSSSEFAMTYMGSLHHFLGITGTRDIDGLFIISG